jgi:hypothetical protein
MHSFEQVLAGLIVFARVLLVAVVVWVVVREIRKGRQAPKP